VLFSDALLPLGFIGPLPLHTELSKVADNKLAPDLVHVIGSTLVGKTQARMGRGFCAGGRSINTERTHVLFTGVMG
jgi:hypothetical protein